MGSRMFPDAGGIRRGARPVFEGFVLSAGTGHLESECVPGAPWAHQCASYENQDYCKKPLWRPGYIVLPPSTAITWPVT